MAQIGEVFHIELPFRWVKRERVKRQRNHERAQQREAVLLAKGTRAKENRRHGLAVCDEVRLFRECSLGLTDLGLAVAKNGRASLRLLLHGVK